MKFESVRVTEIFDELPPLLHKHWKEIAHYQDILLEPDWELYAKLDEMKMLRTFTARDPEGKLVGYAIFFVKPNMHYKSSIQAVQDILFIDPESRGFGRNFISWCDDQLKEEKVQAVYHHIKAKHNFGPMLERMGYELVDLIYARRLD